MLINFTEYKYNHDYKMSNVPGMVITKCGYKPMYAEMLNKYWWNV